MAPKPSLQKTFILGSPEVADFAAIKTTFKNSKKLK